MTTSKITITDIQRAVLEAAAAREGGFAWPLPEALGLRKGSAVLVMKALLGKGLVKERRARTGEPVWREDADGKPMAAVITRAGLAAIGAGTADGMTAAMPGSTDAHSATCSEGEADPGVSPGDADHRRMARAGSKLAMLIELLSRDEGATVPEMVAATGWQAHTVRGVMSGASTRKFGSRIMSEKVEGRGRIYRASPIADREAGK